MKAVTFFALFGGLLFAFFAVMSAHAQTPPGPLVPKCGSWPDQAERLVTGYGEAVMFEGQAAFGAPNIVIMAARDGTTWTALTVEPSGLACIRGEGGRWRTGPPLPPAGEEG